MTKRSRETLERLGVLLVDCPLCGKSFRYERNEQHFVLFFVDGECADESVQLHDITDPYCSIECAEKRAETLNATAAPKHSYVAWTNERWNEVCR